MHKDQKVDNHVVVPESLVDYFQKGAKGSQTFEGLSYLAYEI